MMDYERIISKTAQNIKPSGIRRFFDIAAEMDDVISLGIGEPDFVTPWHIRKEGIEALKKGKTWYTANAGLKKLRSQIAEYIEARTGITYGIDEVLVTVGGSEAIDLAIRAIVEQGDEVIIPEPSFVCYTPITQLSGGVPVAVKTREENEFRLTADELKSAITPKTKLLILPFPNNPTGAIMRRQDLEEIAEVLKGTDIIVISDEIYSELTYGIKHVSPAEIDGMRERTIMINGFSKAYSMTGWRMGYVCAPREILSVMTKIHQYGIMSAPTTSQYAAIEALKNGDEDILFMRNEYNIRRNLILNELRRMGLSCFEPRGAFYIFPNISVTGFSSQEFAEKLLKEEHVAVIPGSAFGESGEGYVRISYCYSTEHILEALRRIERFLKKLRV